MSKHIKEILKETKPSFSFEFFPPKTTEASKILFETIQHLVPLNPSYVSVTYGAGGSTRELTHELVVKLQKENNLNLVAHLTCIGSTKDDIFSILKKYEQSGVRNIMVLRGDSPNGETNFNQVKNGFQFASELVAFIKNNFPQIGIGVAGFPEGHPETPNRLKEMDFLKMKVDAGADYICTQLFFDNGEFFDFRERCELAGIKIPIIAGIMPINSKKGMERMAELALGTKYPAKLLRMLSRGETDEAIERISAHWATEQVSDLVDNEVDGIHFYTLNRSKVTLQIFETLNLAMRK
ncbi:MAG: methylenetetrahydrofolate reductase [NAD(P)H] [Bacteroidota bacterium]